MEISEKALAGAVLDAAAIEALYALETFTPEAAYVQWAGRRMSAEASGGVAEIHAQIGLNASPCPMNCHFCSFAACNKLRQSAVEIPLAEVREYAKIYEDQGANLILLLMTANYSFDRFLEAAAEVRRVIRPELPLLANTGDFDLPAAREMKKAGINGIYHAIRLGEGKLTGIKPETRRRTIAAAQAAGLKLCTCVEPVGPEHTAAELTEATLLCRELDPVFSGAGKRVAVPGSLLEKNGMCSEARMALYVAVYRLATGRGCALNCSGHSMLTAQAGANIAWAEVGTNPRDLLNKTERGGRGENIANLRKIFDYTEWEVLDGPSPGWM
jgi:biotin synthase